MRVRPLNEVKYTVIHVNSDRALKQVQATFPEHYKVSFT